MRLPDGSSAKVARRWTDADGPHCPELAGHSQLCLSGLRELLNLCNALRARWCSESGSAGGKIESPQQLVGTVDVQAKVSGVSLSTSVCAGRKVSRLVVYKGRAAPKLSQVISRTPGSWAPQRAQAAFRATRATPARHKLVAGPSPSRDSGSQSSRTAIVSMCKVHDNSPTSFLRDFWDLLQSLLGRFWSTGRCR